MKIIHSADIHLGSKIEAKLTKEKANIRKAEVRQAFNKMVNYAALNDIKIILISGDLFDSARPLKKDKEYFYNVVKNNPDIDFIYLKGNHDTAESGFDEDIANLKLFSDKWASYFYEDVTVSGIEFLGHNEYEIINGLKLPENTKNIVMLHAESKNIPQIKEKNIDYMALGHIHTFSEAKFNIRGKAFYSGCLEGRGFDEIGIKGFVVLDTETMSVDFIENSLRVIEEFDVDITGSENSYEAYKIVKDSISSDQNNICMINLCGEINYDGLFLTEDIEEYLKDEYFFVYVKNKTIEKIDLNKLANENTLKGEFVRTVLESEQYSQQQKEQIISVGLKAFEGQGVLK